MTYKFKFATTDLLSSIIIKPAVFARSSLPDHWPFAPTARDIWSLSPRSCVALTPNIPCHVTSPLDPVCLPLKFPWKMNIDCGPASPIQMQWVTAERDHPPHTGGISAHINMDRGISGEWETQPEMGGACKKTVVWCIIHWCCNEPLHSSAPDLPPHTLSLPPPHPLQTYCYCHISKNYEKMREKKCRLGDRAPHLHVSQAGNMTVIN